MLVLLPYEEIVHIFVNEIIFKVNFIVVVHFGAQQLNKDILLNYLMYFLWWLGCLYNILFDFFMAFF